MLHQITTNIQNQLPKPKCHDYSLAEDALLSLQLLLLCKSPVYAAFAETATEVSMDEPDVQSGTEALPRGFYATEN